MQRYNIKMICPNQPQRLTFEFKQTGQTFYVNLKKRFYNESCGLCIDIPPVWCGRLAHVVRMLSTNGADGMHHMCGGLTLLLYM